MGLIPINLDDRTKMRADSLENGTYVVLGLTMFTFSFKNNNETTQKTQPVPIVGRLDSEKKNIVSVHVVIRSDVARRTNDVVDINNVSHNNTGTFVDFASSLVANTPVGVHPDIYYALKVFPDLRTKAFVTTATKVTCRSNAGRLYTATIYKHDIDDSVDTSKLLNSSAKIAAVQKLLNARGLEFYGLDGTVEFGDADGNKIDIDTDKFVPKA